MKINCKYAKTCVWYYQRLKQQFNLDKVESKFCEKCYHNQNVRDTEDSYFKLYY